MFKKKLLNKAILVSVLGGMMLAPSFALALTITGTADDTVASTGVKSGGITTGSTANPKNTGSTKTSYKKYTYSGDVTLDGITLNGTNAWLVNSKNKTLTVNGIAAGDDMVAINIINGGDFNFTSATATTSNLVLNAMASGTANAYGFYLNNGLGYMPFMTTNISVSGAAGVYGLYADNSTFIGAYGTSVKDFVIGSKSGETITYGLSTTATGSDMAAGIYATNNSEVLVPKYTAYVQGNGIVSKSGSKVAVGSDKASSATTIYVDNANTNNYAALLADGGQIDINLKDTFSKGVITFGAVPHTNEVKINGNVVATNSGTVNLAMTKSTSTWEGVAYNNGGTVNLWLQNGAIWTNDKWGDQTGFNGSHITNLTGGAAGTEGIIMMKDTNALTIDKLDGMVKVFYAHTNDGDEASDYAGDIKITSANASTSITLITDKTGIDMANNTAVEAALMALSGKLYYLGYTTGEENLAGYVQIAEGLTASSAMLKAGNIAFDNSTGKGSYEPDVYKTAQTKFALGNVITGVVDNDKAYKKAGILREDGKYHLDDTTTITLSGSGADYRGITNTGNVEIIGSGKTLNLNVTGDATTAYGIYQLNKDGSNVNNNTIKIDVGTLKINLDNTKRAEAISIKNTDYDNPTQMNIKGDVKIKVHAGLTALMGVHTFANSFVNIDGNLTIKDPDTADGKWGTNGYGTNGATLGFVYFGNAAVYVQSGLNACQKSGGVNITGDVDIVSQAAALYINGGGGVINIDGGGYIEIDPTIYKEGTTGGMVGGDTVYDAMRAEDGYIYMNVVKDTVGAVKGNVTGAGNKKVNIKGNLGVTCGADNSSLDPNHYESFINLGLNTADSTWIGVAHNAYSNNVTGAVPFRGEINLWLANGATWTNELYGHADEHPYAGLSFYENDSGLFGSRINKLTGGATAATAGIIVQNDARPITIDSYSGYTKFIFSHNNSGTAITDYSAGDIIIKNAASGSNVSLITDNQGINTSNTTVVDNVLGALARKLYYTAYVDGETNLTGSVGIAEGLTGSSATLVSDNFDYIAETGQGVYKDIVPPAEPVDPTPAVVSSDVLTATMKDKAFLNDKITSSNNVVNYNLTDKAYSYHSLNAAANSKAVIDVGDANALYFDGKTNKNLGIVLNDGANVTINGNVDVSSYSESYSAAGIAMIIGGSGIGKKTDLTINGKVTMGSADAPGVIAEDKHGAYSTYNGTRWTGAAINMNMGHGSTINITDGLTAYVDGHGIVTDPYYADKNYKDEQLAVVNVNGPTNITVKSNEDVGLYALANFGGTINVNMQNGQPGTDKVNIHGNTMVMKDTMGAEDNPYFYRSGEINLALTTADSMWSGVADNTGASQTGKFNLYLKNGGTWNYENASKTNGLSASSMPSPSLSYYGNYDGVSHITSLTGGKNNSDAGKINMVSDDKIIVGSYSGNINVDYSNNSGSSMSGGIMSIASADVASVITLTASDTGVTAENYQQVLNALAGQLYYTAGNENLIGKLKIDGTNYSGYIAFDGSGKGYFTTESNKTLAETPLGGLNDDNFENVVVSGSDTARTYTMTNGIKVEVATGSAIVTKNANAANADVIVKNGNNLLVLVADQKTSPVIDASNGNVSIDGEVRMRGQEGQKLIDAGSEKKVVIGGGEIRNADTGAGDGTVSNPAIDMKDGSSVYIGEYVDSSNKKVFSNRDVQFTGDVKNTKGSFNIALMTDKSYWDGDYQNEDAEFNIDINSHGAKWSGSANGDVINVNLTQGTWVNMGASSSTGNNFTLKGGGAGKAFLDMSNASSGNVTIDNYSGGMTIIYGHEAATPTTIPGGTVRVVNAAQGSVINMMTLNAGVDMNDPDSILDTMDAVAHKLLYTNYATEGNIKGTVGIGEGLTRPTMVTHIADYKFDAEPASIDRTTLRDTFAHGEIVYGDTETAMMRGAKMAMASTTMTWRAENNDLLKRMGDLRLKKDEDGIWARYYSGHNEFDNNGSFSSKYKAFQVGFDSEMPHGWLGGVAFSFNDGTSTYNNGGHGDNDIKSLAFYGTKVNKDGQYIDLIAKLSHLENEYTVFNDYGFSLDGDYKNYGMSLSAEYGKKIPLKNNAYIIPSAELTVGRIGSKSYNAWSEYYEKNLSVEQDAFDSVVGRLNVCVGQETPRGTYYVKVGAAHEFSGSFDTTYSAMNEPTSSTNIDFKDTWLEMRVGGSIKLKNDAVLYGSFGKTIAGDIKEKWRVDAGLMFTFSDFKEFFMGSPKKSNLTTVSETETEIATINEVNNTATVEDAGVEMDGNKASVSVGDGVAIMETKPIAGTENVFMLDECVVTANRTKQRITDATADISVVTRQEIENMNMKNVEEALRTVPGIQFQNYGGGNQLNANISGLRINGSKDIAVLVDGVKINDFQGIGESGYMYAGVLNNMNNIERIEVLRGAAGTLYGSGAKGGVINIITRDIEESKTVTDVSLGSFGQEDYKFNTMGKEGKFTYNIYEGTSRQGDIKDGKGNTWEGHTKSKSYGTKLIYDIDDKNKVTLDYMDISSNYSGTDAIYNNTYQGKYDSTMMNVRHDLQINDNITNTFVYRHNNEKRFHSQQYYTGLSLKNSDTNYSYDFITDQFTYHDKKNNLVVGVDYSKGKDKNSTKVEGHNVNREMSNTSFYANEDFKILKNVTLSAGIRRDAPKEDDYGGKIEDHTTKSYKASWDITKKDTVYAARSEYFVLPSMNQLFDPEWGNSELHPAEGRTSSIGYNKKIDDNNFLTVNYFKTEEECGIGWHGTELVNTNGVSRGWNAQYTTHINKNWDVNFGWSHLFYYAEGDNLCLGYYPRDLADFGVYYNIGKFMAGFDGYWFFRKKDYSGRREFPADNYGIYNLSLNYRPSDRMKLYFKVNNLFNKYYAEHTDSGNDPYLTGNNSYYAMPGRAFMSGFEFTF